jgi:hypothetical protein
MARLSLLVAEFGEDIPYAVLVSGDRDLTDFVTPPVPVMTPRTLLDRLERPS